MSLIIMEHISLLQLLVVSPLSLALSPMSSMLDRKILAHLGSLITIYLVVMKGHME